MSTASPSSAVAFSNCLVLPPTGDTPADKQGSSLDGDDVNSRASHTSTAVASNQNTSPHAGLQSPNATTPSTTSPERTSPPHTTRGGGGGGGAAAAAAATPTVAELGPWGRGSQEDEARLTMEAKASTTEDMEAEEEVPKEPDAGEGVRTAGVGGGGAAVYSAGGVLVLKVVVILVPHVQEGLMGTQGALQEWRKRDRSRMGLLLALW